MPKDIPQRHEVAVDEKGRISLEFRVHKEHRLFLAEEYPGGVLVLTPGALVPAVVRAPEPPGELPVEGTSMSKIREHWEEQYYGNGPW